MALRHLTLNDPQYVPQYNTLDANLVAGVAGTIQQQSERAMQEDASAFGTLKENTLAANQSLPDEFQGELMDMYDESRSRIDESLERKGPRATRNMMRREAQELSQKMRPYQTAAQQSQAYQQRIQEAEKVDPRVRQWAREQAGVIRDDDGSPRFQQTVSLDAFDNWQNLNEVTQEFLKQANSDTVQSGLQHEPGFEGQYLRRISQEILSGDKMKTAAVGNLLSNDQYRTQLEMALLSREIDPNESVTVVTVPEQKHPETGEILQEEKTLQTTQLHKEAARIVDPSATAKAFVKETYTGTRENLEFQRLMDDSMPSMANTIRMGVDGHGIDSFDKLHTSFGEKQATIESLQQEIENTDNPFQRIRLEDSLKQIETERDNILTHQNRAIAEAGFSLEQLQQIVRDAHEEEQLNQTSEGTITKAAYGRLAPRQPNKKEDVPLQEFLETGVLNQRALHSLRQHLGADAVVQIQNSLKQSAEAFATNSTVTGFTSKSLADTFTQQGSLVFHAGGQGEGSQDFVRIHSDPNKKGSIYESGFVDGIKEIEAGGYYVDPNTSELHIAYKAFGEDKEPLGLIGSKAPTGTFDYLRPEQQHKLASYQSSMIDVAMRAPGKEVTIQHPVFQDGNPIGATNVTIRSRYAQKEDGSISSKDTYDSAFLLIFEDLDGKKLQVPADSKGEALRHLEHISRNNIDGIREGFGLPTSKK